MLSIVNVECAIISDHRYLLIQRSSNKKHAPGMLGFPGGKVDMNDQSIDTLELCAKREVSEEIGLEIKGPLQYVHSSSFFLPDKTFVINIVVDPE